MKLEKNEKLLLGRLAVTKGGPLPITLYEKAMVKLKRLHATP